MRARLRNATPVIISRLRSLASLGASLSASSAQTPAGPPPPGPTVTRSADTRLLDHIASDLQTEASRLPNPDLGGFAADRDSRAPHFFVRQFNKTALNLGSRADVSQPVAYNPLLPAKGATAKILIDATAPIKDKFEQAQSRDVDPRPFATDLS